MTNKISHAPIITLCGSTKFPNLWHEANKALSLSGCIVLTVGMFGHQENMDMAGPIKKKLDKLHFQKICISNAIFVLNREGYIGLSTWDEIFFALANMIPVYFHKKLTGSCAKDFLALLESEKLEEDDENIFPLIASDGSVRGVRFRERYECQFYTTSGYELRKALQNAWDE